MRMPNFENLQVLGSSSIKDSFGAEICSAQRVRNEWVEFSVAEEGADVERLPQQVIMHREPTLRALGVAGMQVGHHDLSITVGQYANTLSANAKTLLPLDYIKTLHGIGVVSTPALWEIIDDDLTLKSHKVLFGSSRFTVIADAMRSPASDNPAHVFTVYDGELSLDTIYRNRHNLTPQLVFDSVHPPIYPQRVLDTFYGH